MIWRDSVFFFSLTKRMSHIHAIRVGAKEWRRKCLCMWETRAWRKTTADRLIQRKAALCGASEWECGGGPVSLLKNLNGRQIALMSTEHLLWRYLYKLTHTLYPLSYWWPFKLLIKARHWRTSSHLRCT